MYEVKDIMKNVKTLIIFVSKNGEVLLEANKNDDNEIYLHGEWNGDNDDIVSDDDLFDIVSRTLEDKYLMDEEIKNIITFPNGIPICEN